MRNALDVITEMTQWWHSASPVPRTRENALNVGITWLYNRTYGDYARMTEESSKIAHFRQLFTVWKAVCQRLPQWSEDFAGVQWGEHNALVKVYPAYLEKTLPDLFPVLLANRVFLGVTFTPEETARHEQLTRAFTRSDMKLKPYQQAAAKMVKRYG